MKYATLLLVAFTAVTSATASEGYIWRGETLSRWTAGKNCQVTNVTGGIFVRATGNGPELNSPRITFHEFGAEVEIAIRARGSVGGKARLQYKRHGDKDFKALGGPFDWIADGDWHTYRLPVAAKAPMTVLAFKLDLPGGEGAQHAITEISMLRKTPGPRLSPAEFLSTCLRTDVPELKDISDKAKKGAVDEAIKDFAAFIRKEFTTPGQKGTKRERLCQGMVDHRPEVRAREEAAAKRTMEWRLSSCGFEHQFAKGAIEWECNPTYNNYAEWPFQLARHGDINSLARYYLETGDEQATETYLVLVKSFIDQQLVPKHSRNGGATWCWRSIDSAGRLMGWIRQFLAFLTSPKMTDEFIVRYFASVQEHAHHLMENYTSGNWLIIELDAILQTGTIYTFLADAPAWRKFAVDLWSKELDAQVYPDGFQFELSTGYHGTVLENSHAFFNVCDRLGIKPPAFLTKKTELMYDMYLKLMEPDFRTPALNDGYRASASGWLWSAADRYPERKEFLWTRTQGAEGTPPPYLSVGMEYAGMAVFRSAWQRDAVWGFLDGGPFGFGHQHEDKLNVLLSAYGKEMLVDPGNFSYDSSEMRKYVQATRGHNCVLFDGLGQNRRKNYVRDMTAISRKATEFTFATTPERDEAESVYEEGFGPKLEKFVHRRKVVFLKKEAGLLPFFIIEDRFTSAGGGLHHYEALWHLEAENLTLGARQFVADFGDGVRLVSVVSDETASLTNMRGSKNPYQGWMPIAGADQHEHRPIPTAVVKGDLRGRKRVVTVLYPMKDAGLRPISVEAAPEITATDVKLTLSDGTTRTFSTQAK